jgi:hypothetical protein
MMRYVVFIIKRCFSKQTTNSLDKLN